MSDLVAFLRARLDEDEAVAKAAAVGCPSPWHDDFGDLADASEKLIVDGVDYGGAAWRNADAITHIVRHDPARVLREVEAKRSIVTRYEFAGRQADINTGIEQQVWERIAGALERDAADLAAVYRDHPDYDQAWKPSAASGS